MTKITVDTWGEKFAITIDKTQEDICWVEIDCGDKLYQGFIASKERIDIPKGESYNI